MFLSPQEGAYHTGSSPALILWTPRTPRAMGSLNVIKKYKLKVIKYYIFANIISDMSANIERYTYSCVENYQNRLLVFVGSC